MARTLLLVLLLLVGSRAEARGLFGEFGRPDLDRAPAEVGDLTGPISLPARLHYGPVAGISLENFLSAPEEELIVGASIAYETPDGLWLEGAYAAQGDESGAEGSTGLKACQRLFSSASARLWAYAGPIVYRSSGVTSFAATAFIVKTLIGSKELKPAVEWDPDGGWSFGLGLYVTETRL